MKPPIVLITGAGRGIGRAAAIRIARGGGVVALMSRTAAELEETSAIIRMAGGEALVVPGDVTNETDVSRAVGVARDRYGRIDVLVNSAGVAPLSPMAEMTTETFDRLVAVNVRGVFLACRAVWPIMAAGGGGTIITVSSRAARDPFPGFAAYGGTKAFVETFTLAIAEEGRSVGIRAFAVAPGAVDTKMLRDLIPEFPADQMLSPDCVAEVIERLAGENAETSSGQTVSLEAGESKHA